MAYQGTADPESPESRRVNNHTRNFNDLKLHFLVIKIRKGIDLKAADITLKGGNSDPFCEVTANDQKFSTKTIMKNLNPEWNEETTFCFFDLVKELKFEVYDWDKGSKHDSIGYCTLDTSNFFTDNNPGFSGDLTLLKVKKGKVNVSVYGKLVIPHEIQDRIKMLEEVKLAQDRIIVEKNAFFDDLNDKNKILLNTNNSYKNEKFTTEEKIQELTTEEENVKNQNLKIQSDIENSKQEIININNQTKDYQTKAEGYRNDIDESQKKMKSLQARKHTLMERMESYRQEILE